MATATSAVFAGAKEFLRQNHLAPLLTNDLPALQTLNKWTTVGTALQALDKARVLSCPVLDEDGEYFGCLSVNDLIRSLNATLQAKDPEWTEKLDEMTPADLLSLGKEFCAQTVDKLQHAGDLWLLNADDASTLMDAVHHRLYVCSTAQPGRMIRSPSQKTTVVNVTPGSERMAASGLKVTHVVSQTDVIKLLWQNRACFGPTLNATIEELEMDDGACWTVPASMPALEAFGFMARDHKSSLGLVDAGKLVANLSVSDLRGLTPEEFPLLLLSAAEFVAVRNGIAGVTKEEALAGKRVAGAKEGGYAAVFAAAPVVTVSTSSTFEEVLGALVNKSLHRIYVVDGAGAAVSIVTPTDILRLITRA
ncbi:hypothetical protein Rsub_04886 [Raphidocelis subcapitata]|uniref:CBS domain-containing protein n=1 Tax=Raphidocelis subcapitata TaxID=307507 RepID=A0A2V0P1Z2_9CHLO|nr:hypothetical protein Rsub_04886 [Raphidocelis subcapitata]|eukprot:GBF91217.1 hypothetical protein Rsub_04886 [Raphidocelis subcapitata]